MLHLCVDMKYRISDVKLFFLKERNSNEEYLCEYYLTCFTQWLWPLKKRAESNKFFI